MSCIQILLVILKNIGGKMKVGFTGTRKGLTDKQKELLTEFFKNNIITELHHGDAPGSDTEAHVIFLSIYPNAKVFLYPSDLERANNKASINKLKS